MVGAIMAINGALTNSVNPPYTIQSNVFYMPGGNGIQTTPAQNVTITRNTFIGNGGGTAIALGVAGQQGSAVNSNIVVSLNLFTNVYDVVVIEGAGPNLVRSVLVSNNLAEVHNFAVGYGWSTNVVFAGNTSTGLGGNGGLDSSQLQGQWYFDDPSDQFPPLCQADVTGKTNTITYATGMRHQIWVNVTNSVWVIDDTHPRQVPPGATLQITSTGKFPMPLYLSASMSGTPIVLATGQMVTCQWTNGAWANILTPPINLYVIEP